MMEKNAKIYVAGHRGMVGSAIVRELQRQGYDNLVLRTHKELDLTRQDQVEAFLPKKDRNMFFWLPQRWAVSWGMLQQRQTSCTIT